MSKKIASRCITCLLVALLLSVQAFAMEVPVSQTEQMIDGKQTLTKVFEVTPSVDPETLKEDGLELNGYSYALTSFTKEVFTKEDSEDVSETQTIVLKTTKEDDAYIEALKTLPQTIDYEKDGYSGKLNIVVSSIEITETGRSNHTGTSKVTKTYTLDYNDDTLVPSTVTEKGNTYKRAKISWAEGSFSEGSTIPDNYVATVTYTRGYSYSTVDGYQATATYSGEVFLEEDEMIRYTAQYIGSPVVDESPNSWVGKFLVGLIIVAFIAAIAVAAYMLLFKKKEESGSEGEGEVMDGEIVETTVSNTPPTGQA